jgi:TldD protein
MMNVLADRTQRGALATVGWDDEGVPADSWPIVKDGFFVDYQEDYLLDDLIAATDRGILIKGRGSYSIDQQRFNFQFGGQVFYEVRDGAVTEMLKDVAYQGRTPEFWNSLDMLGGARSYELGGTFYDGKGQPSQSNAVSHGCPPARFRGVSVINTGRS